MTAADDFGRRVALCWSRATASTHTARDPARGQCSVTALLAHEVLGGGIVKTRVDGAWHFYNLVDGLRLDFTAGQFPRPPVYEDVGSGPDEALADTSPVQLEALRRAFHALDGPVSGSGGRGPG